MARRAGDFAHSTRLSRRLVWTTVLVAGATSVGGNRQAPESTGTQQSSARHNPHELHATQMLERRAPGTPTRVRFDWDQVAGAREYRLSGRWTSPPSWAVQTREFHVTARNAVAWTARSVAFEAEIPEGNHSWGIVALFEGGTRLASRGAGVPPASPALVGDFANPTTLSFDIR